MKITVQLEAQLQQAAGKREIETSLPEGSSLLTLLQQIAVGGGDAFRDRLFAPEGELLSTVLLFVNEQPVATGAASDHVLSDGDCVLLLPPISGG